MRLSDSQKEVVAAIQNGFQHEDFTLASLSLYRGKTVVGTTLSGLVTRKIIEKVGDHPARYRLIKSDRVEALTDTLDCAKPKNLNLNAARANKNDEFYTKIEDLYNELPHYKQAFVGKKIFLNCNDTKDSAFWKFFIENFSDFQLKKLTAISFSLAGNALKLTTENGTTIVEESLLGSGAFGSEESLKELQDCDIVVTNPPFSLMRDFIALMIDNDKKFLVITNQNIFTSEAIFPLFKENLVWTGINSVRTFSTPEGFDKKFGNICWLTNIRNDVSRIPIPLTCSYDSNKEAYPCYDNYYAIDVSKLREIPNDYYEPIGVPITILNKFCPEQFEILGISEESGIGGAGELRNRDISTSAPCINGVKKYCRIFVRLKHN